MSYLDTPRLVFSGRFQADPSTINNDPHHFDTGTFRSNDELWGLGVANGWWNPNGSGAWRFRDCVVRQVVYGDGTVCDDPNIDPVIGALVNDSNIRVEGKLVDLDSEQQMVSQIWGFQVALSPSPTNPSQPVFGFRSDFQMAPFADIWVRVPSGQPDSFFGAFYQSILTNIEWVGAGNDTWTQNSRYLRELAGAGGPPPQLSIRFNVDAYNMADPTAPEFTFGRVVGAIGPYDSGEPVHFVAGRSLQPPIPPPNPSLNTAYAQVEGDVLTLDMGNSLPDQALGGPTINLGTLYAAILPPPPAQPVILGSIPYTDNDWYAKTAGIISYTLDPKQAELAASAQLGVVQSGPNGIAPMLSEAPNGLWLRADQFVFRLNPGEKGQQDESNVTTFYATTFGQPTAGQQISLAYDSTIMQGFVQQDPTLVPGPLPGQPETVLSLSVPPPSCEDSTGETTLPLPATITTGSDGKVTVALKATDPGNPRGYIDGQIYGVTYGPGPEPPPVGAIGNSSQILNALVFSGYDAPDEPDWMIDVQPIFEQYANLYPVMRPIVDLADYASVVSRTAALFNVFSRSLDDPNYMPVTRDLSKPKRDMILNWLKGSPPLYMKLDSKEDLMVALQQAIELEHSTIPPYLTALYSIKPGANEEVAELIRSVVIEEMLHMALVCNIVVSLGGSPQIGKPGFVPNYPGPLPGGLLGGLTVRLRRCSIEQIRDVFMFIEKPEVTMDPAERAARRAGSKKSQESVIERIHNEVKEALTGSDDARRKQLAEPLDMRGYPGGPRTANPYTIGWFYDQIKESLTNLSGASQISFGHADQQVSDWTGTGKLYVINSLEDAIRAIDEIKSQGEGASPRDPDDGDSELAHYYKFSEIVHGRRIIVGKDGYSYTGGHIPFDPNGVYAMTDDPEAALFPDGSRALILSKQFAETYQALLNGLHRTFNGEPDYLGQAVGIMFSLSVIARNLMQTPSGLGDGTTAGPSFQLPDPL
ncbi:MAG: hypothetical protein H7Y30_02310 [Pyrinomonadaceae bacterium]|nr:hypothetical protein [Pyrinomonadaceae bacterium]